MAKKNIQINKGDTIDSAAYYANQSHFNPLILKEKPSVAFKSYVNLANKNIDDEFNKIYSSEEGKKYLYNNLTTEQRKQYNLYTLNDIDKNILPILKDSSSENKQKWIDSFYNNNKVKVNYNNNSYDKEIFDKAVKDFYLKKNTINQNKKEQSQTVKDFKKLSAFAAGGLNDIYKKGIETGRFLNQATDFVGLDNIPLLGKLFEYNSTTYDNAKKFGENVYENYLSNLANDDEERRNLQLAGDLGELFTPNFAFNMKFNSLGTKPFINAAKNLTGLGLSTAVPGQPTGGIKEVATSIAPSILFSESDAYHKQHKGPILDYTDPVRLANEQYIKDYDKFVINTSQSVINQKIENDKLYEKYGQPIEYGTLIGLGALGLGTFIKGVKNAKNIVSVSEDVVDLTKETNLQKLRSISEELSLSEKLNANNFDRYSVADKFIKQDGLTKNYLPNFYSSDDEIANAIYNTGYIDKNTKFNVAPRITDTMIFSLKQQDINTYNKLNNYINEYTKIANGINRAIRNNKQPSLLIKNMKKLNNDNLELFNNSTIKEILQQIDNQNKVIDKLAVKSGVKSQKSYDEFYKYNKHNFSKQLKFSYDEDLDEIIRKYIDIDSYDVANEAFISSSSEDLLTANNKKLRYVMRVISENNKRRKFIEAVNTKEYDKFDKSFNDTITDIIRETSKEKPNEDSYNNIINSGIINITKGQKVRYVGSIDLNTPTKYYDEPNITDIHTRSVEHLKNIFSIEKYKLNSSKIKEFEKRLNVLNSANTDKALKMLKSGINNGNNDILTYFDNGKLLVYKVDDYIGSMFNMKNPDMSNTLIYVNNSLRNFKQSTLTGTMNPAFAPVSAIYTAQEALTTSGKIIDDVNLRLKDIDKIQKFTKIKRKLAKGSNKDDLLPEYDEEIVNIIKPQLVKDSYNYIKNIFKSGKDIRRQIQLQKASDKMTYQLTKSLLNGASEEEIAATKAMIYNYQKDLNNLLSTRLQLGGFTTTKPLNIDNKFINIDKFSNFNNAIREASLNNPSIKNVPAKLLNTIKDTINNYNIIVREAPVQALTRTIAEKFGVIKNNKIIDQKLMNVIHKSISQNVANTKLKGNYLGNVGKVTKFIDDYATYGSITTRSIGAKLKASQLSEVIPNIAEDFKNFVKKDITFGDLLDNMYKNSKKLIKNNNNQRIFASAFGIEFLSYIVNHRSPEIAEAYYSLPESTIENNITFVLNSDGTTITVPVDQEYNIPRLVAKKEFSNILGNPYNTINPAINYNRMINHGIGRSVIPGGFELLNALSGIVGIDLDIDFTSRFGGVKELKEDFLNSDYSETQNINGVFNSYAMNLFDNLLGVYSIAIANGIEEDVIDARANDNTNNITKNLVEKGIFNPNRFITSKISSYNDTNVFVQDRLNLLDKYAKMRSNKQMTPNQVMVFDAIKEERKRLGLNVLEEIKQQTIKQNKLQKVNGIKELIIDHEGRKLRVKNAEKFILKINSMMYYREKELDNRINNFMINYGITGANFDNFLVKVK